MAKMSKEMPLKVFAKQYRWNPKEEQWILDNDKDTHYYNNSALKNAWSSLSYPIYDGDYYFAFIHDKPRVNAQYNAKANRELRKYIKSFLDEDEIFDRMEKYFSMQFKDAGAGDTMTREELWTAIVDMRKKNPAPKRPANEELQEVSLGNNMLRKDFPNVWATRDAKLYRVLAQLVSQDGFVDNMKAYKKNPKDYLNRLRDIAKNPKKYEKSFGRNFAQYINKPKPGQAYAKLPESANILDAYKDMVINEEVANITVDPRNKINSGQQQAYHGMEIAKQARRFGLKSSVMHKHVRIKGPKKKVNDFLRVVIGKSSYGDPTEKDMSTPQIDKMLTKGLK